MITAFIPARKGSTRLKDKNLETIRGLSISGLAVAQALASGVFSEVIFSSDSAVYRERVQSEIASLGLNPESLRLHSREPEQAGPSAKIRDVLRTYAQSGILRNPWLALMLPTAPLRSIETLASMVDICNKREQPIFTACEYNFPVSFAFKPVDNDTAWQPVFHDSPMITGMTRSQDQAVFLRPHGGAAIMRVSDLAGSNSTIYHGAMALETHQVEGLDIDTREDFMLVRATSEQLTYSAPFFERDISAAVTG